MGRYLQYLNLDVIKVIDIHQCLADVRKCLQVYHRYGGLHDLRLLSVLLRDSSFFLQPRIHQDAILYKELTIHHITMTTNNQFAKLSPICKTPCHYLQYFKKELLLLVHLHIPPFVGSVFSNFSPLNTLNQDSVMVALQRSGTSTSCLRSVRAAALEALRGHESSLCALCSGWVQHSAHQTSGAEGRILLLKH